MEIYKNIRRGTLCGSLYYDKNNPNNIREKAYGKLLYIVYSVGFLLIIISISILVHKKRKEYIKKKLLNIGKIINATYVDKKINTRIGFMGQNPYNIICEWIDLNTNKKYTFKSENIWYNPQKYIDEKKIKTFKVYVKPNNMKKYYVDIREMNDNVVNLTLES